jgi:aryl-alcohol dehydrogenase-like predicted oxidoreductase
MKLGIGTAQLGMRYGITNKSSKLKFIDFKKIILLSVNNKIYTIDTANNYGDSEIKIGKAILKTKYKDKFKIVSKIGNIRKVKISNIYKHILDSVSLSISVMGVKNLEGILIHDIKDLESNKADEIFYSLIRIKNMGLIKKIGFSAYKIFDVIKYIKKYKFDFIQFPLNIFDQRILAKNIQKKLKKHKVELHIRSIFLQGLLLLPKNKLPMKFKNKTILKNWHKFLNGNNLDPLTACINFIKQNNIYTKVIIGFNSYNQFNEVLKKFTIKKRINLNFEKLATKNSSIINPSKWN